MLRYLQRQLSTPRNLLSSSITTRPALHSQFYTTMSSNKKARTHPSYELIYWPGIPGRGEFIRLAFEAAGVSYKDVTNEAKDDGTCQPAHYTQLRG